MSQRIPEFDAVRGLAASAVVLYHYTTRYEFRIGHVDEPWFSVPWGHYGVELFFLLSGFVIFMTLHRAASVRDFAVSRVSRLYPGYWCGMLCTLAAVALMGWPFDGYELGVTDVLINVTMLTRYVPGAQQIDGAYWTLCVEMTFYVLIAGLFALRQLRHIRVWIVALLVLEVTMFVLTDGGDKSSPIYLLGLREVLLRHYGPYFCGGIVFYEIYTKGVSRRDLVLLGGCLVAIAVMRSAEEFIASVACFGIFALLTTRRLGVLANRPLLWLGAISYSLYVVHQYIGFLLIRHATEAGMGTNLAIALAIAFSLALAALITYGVERPAQRWLRSRWLRPRTRTSAA